jgi:ABC-type glycerol-3-phosphate transport system substrate-binding protein
MFSRRMLVVSVVMCILVGAAISPLVGQGETIITITAPGWISHIFSSELFAKFEAQHPGVKVVAVEPGEDYYYPPAAEDIEKHLNGAQKYTSVADVIYVDRHIASIQATRAGYFMNLAPFMASDAAFNSEDFFPSLLKSAQWDDGTWYIPSSAYVEMLAYNMKAFDEAGLTYPNERWSFEDFARAVRALTTYDKDGKATLPGFPLYNPGLFYYGLTHQPFYDVGSSPSVPQFDRPDVITFYEQWKSLVEDTTPEGDYDYSQIVFQYGSPWRLPYGGSENEWATTLLPGGVTSLSIEGFAVSGGTLNPELAYALTNFMSTDPQVIEAFRGDTAARRSLLETASDPSIDVQAIEQALEHAVPISELRFQDYLDAALNQEEDDGATLDIQAAIQAAQLKAASALDTATARRGTTTLYVTTPVPTPMMTADQIVLRFGMGLDMSANQSAWTQLTNEFLAANPTVGNVEFDTDFFDPKDREKLDCYYMPYNEVPSMQLESYLSFDPLMSADPTFDRNDFIGSVIDQVTRDNHIWGYPLTIQPSVLWYDADLFDRAGLPSPEQGWTVDGFKDALQNLRGVLDKETDPVFLSGTYGNTYLLMLIAAYGGLPYDYRTTPPTVNFTDPATVDAVRQVLDLAKAGAIGYQAMSGRTMFTLDSTSTVPITDDVFSASSYRLFNRADTGEQDSYRLANFPQGQQFTPMAFGIGAAYIQSNAQNPEACYQWIAKLATRSDLFGGMPARISQVNDPALNAAQGEDITALYQTFMATFQQPNAVIFPSQYSVDSSFSAYLEPQWMNRVFDNYVLEEGDLETGLAEAETFIAGYRACASGITETNTSSFTTQEEYDTYYRQFADCAIQVDPSMMDDLSYLYAEN